MKKTIIVLALGIFAVTLAGCSKNKQHDKWLEGSWRNSQLKLTYNFEQNNDVWQIEEPNGHWVATDAKRAKKSTNKNIMLVDKKGTKFIIEKVDKKHMKFHQEAKSGLLGTTNVIEFEKNDK